MYFASHIVTIILLSKLLLNQNANTRATVKMNIDEIFLWAPFIHFIDLRNLQLSGNLKHVFCSLFADTT